MAAQGGAVRARPILDEALWEVIEPLFPPPKKRRRRYPGRKPVDTRTVPLGRIAEPEDIADVVVFLASGEARYVCGALVEVNGAKFRV